MATDQEKIAFYIPREEAQQIRAICEEESRSISGYIRLLLKRDLRARAAKAVEETAA